jgi:hypothetical protein
MIDDLDEALRKLLIRELPIKNGEVDIAFDQPKRDWSARLSRPTLNFFLYDLRENAKLRSTHPVWENVREPGGATVQKRRPVRVDLRYLVTAWTAEAEDEHRLLTRALMALFRYPHLPEDLLPESLQGQPVPIPLQVAQAENQPNTSDVWSALENTLRAAIVLQVTLALDPYVAVPAGPPVRTRELRYGQTDGWALSRRLLEAAGVDHRWTIGGTLRAKNGALKDAHLTLVERGTAVALQADGRFVLHSLPAGQYTLEVTGEGRPASRHTLTIPAPDYDLEVE